MKKTLFFIYIAFFLTILTTVHLHIVAMHLQFELKPNQIKNYLHTAILANSYQRAKITILQCKDKTIIQRLINEKEPWIGNNKLHYLCQRKKINSNLITLLITHGAQINAQDKILKNTPFHLACENPSVTKETIETFLTNKADLYIKNNSGHTPLHYLIANKNIDICNIQGLLKNIHSENLIHALCSHTNKTTIKKLDFFLKKFGTDIINKKNNTDDNNTPLLALCKKEKPDLTIIEYLLKHGADQSINATNNNQETSLYFACKNNNLKLFNLLLQYGAQKSSSIRNKILGDSPLYFACKHNNNTMTQILLEDIYAIETVQAKTSHKNKTALHCACENNNITVAKKLLQCGAAQSIAQDNATVLDILIEERKKKQNAIENRNNLLDLSTKNFELTTCIVENGRLVRQKNIDNAKENKAIKNYLETVKAFDYSEDKLSFINKKIENQEHFKAVIRLAFCRSIYAFLHKYKTLESTIFFKLCKKAITETFNIKDEKLLEKERYLKLISFIIHKIDLDCAKEKKAHNEIASHEERRKMKKNSKYQDTIIYCV